MSVAWLKDLLACKLMVVFCVMFNSALLVLNLWITIPRAYTYKFNDYPIEAPIQDLGNVLMTIFESTHFQMDTSSLNSNLEWRSIYSGPYTLHLGEEHRIFLIALYHQTHCLRGLEYAFLFPNSTAYTPHHIQHCLNYLRQHFLCQADDELETGDFIEWNSSPGSVYHKDRVCRDWKQVHDAAAEDLDDFTTYLSVKT